MDLSALQQTLREFAAERDWQPFHTPKNLAMALMIEAAELAEIFQWMTPEQSQAAHHDHVTQERISDEVADVLLYLLQVADHTAVDLKRAVGRKLVKNARKHPPVKPGVPVGPKDTALPQTHVLVDWENVQPKDVDIRALVSDVTDVWLFHGPNQRNVDKDQTAFGDRVTCVPISRAGKNALDFHLSFYMGYIASRNPAARFVVLSNDQGYGPMLEHAVDLGFSATLVGFSRSGRGRTASRGGARGGAGRAPATRQAPARGGAGRSAPPRSAGGRAATEQAPDGRPGQRGSAPRSASQAGSQAGAPRGQQPAPARSGAPAPGLARDEAVRQAPTGARRRGRGEGARPLASEPAAPTLLMPVDAAATIAPVMDTPVAETVAPRATRRGRGAGRRAAEQGAAAGAAEALASAADLRPQADAQADTPPMAAAAAPATAEADPVPAKRPARKRASRSAAAPTMATDGAAQTVDATPRANRSAEQPGADATLPAVPAKRSRRRTVGGEPAAAVAEATTPAKTGRAGPATTAAPDETAEPAPAAKRTRRTAAKTATATTATTAAEATAAPSGEAEAAVEAPVPAKKTRASKKAPARAAAKKTTRAVTPPAAAEEAVPPAAAVQPEAPVAKLEPAPAPRREPPARPPASVAPVAPAAPAPKGGAQARPAGRRQAPPPAGRDRQPQPQPARAAQPPARPGFDLDKALRHVESSLRKTANKPTRRARLLSTIRSLLGQHADEANTLAVLQRLLDAGRVSIDGQGTVGYAL